MILDLRSNFDYDYYSGIDSKPHLTVSRDVIGPKTSTSTTSLSTSTTTSSFQSQSDSSTTYSSATSVSSSSTTTSSSQSSSSSSTTSSAAAAAPTSDVTTQQTSGLTANHYDFDHMYTPEGCQTWCLSVDYLTQSFV